MATTFKKTSVSNRTPNTFTLSADGDVGINTHDGKMWVSNGSFIHEVGANLVNLSVQNNISIGNSTVNTNITSANLETADIFAETLEIYDTAIINTHSVTIGYNGLETVITGGSLDLGGRIVFDVDYVVSGKVPGTLSWNIAEDCLDISQSDGSTLQTGLESYIRVRNYTGNTLVQGTLVQFSGVNGDGNPTCVPLLANSTFDPLYTIGVLTNDVPDGEVGRATTFGKVRALNTTGSEVSETWSEGDILWASTTQAGKLTKVKPTAPYPAISVAAVVKSGTTDGELLVRPLIFPRLYYGSFSSNATQTANTSNTAYPVVFNTTDFASGHILQNNSQIVAVHSGLYNYQFSLQLLSGSSAEKNIWIWAAKNGNDVPNTASRITKKDNGVYSVASWNFVLSMDAGDYFELMFAVSDTGLSIPAPSATAFAPAIPSSLLSVTQVNQ